MLLEDCIANEKEVFYYGGLISLVIILSFIPNIYIRRKVEKNIEQELKYT